MEEKIIKLNEYEVEVYNDTVGSLDKIDGYNCPICKNKGHYKKIDENGEIIVVNCGCLITRNMIKIVGDRPYTSKKSKDYICTEKWQEDIKSKLVDYCQNHDKDNVWFCITGQSGAGKTYIGSIISNHLTYNLQRELLYITWTDYIGRLKRDITIEENRSDVNNYLDYVKKVDVLFIDELFKFYTDADFKYLAEIINYRYNHDLKTIITSEKEFSDLLKLDEATFGRVAEKSQSFLINIQKDIKKNYRLKEILSDNDYSNRQ